MSRSLLLRVTSVQELPDGFFEVSLDFMSLRHFYPTFSPPLSYLGSDLHHSLMLSQPILASSLLPFTWAFSS